MKFDHSYHGVEQFVYYLLGTRTSIKDNLALEHFKESFSPKMELLLFKSRLLHATNYLMLVHGKHYRSHSMQEETRKCLRLGIFHEDFCKTEIDPEG